MRRSLLSLVLLLPLVALASPKKMPAPPAAPAAAAPAAPADKPAELSPAEKSAKFHFEQGVKLFNDHDFPGALSEFQASYHDRAVPTVLYNVALSQKAMFHYADATETMQFFLTEAKDLDPKQRKEAEQLLAEWQSLLAVVNISPDPKESRVTVDGKVVPINAEVKVTPGKHEIAVTNEGYDSEKRSVDMPAGLITRLDVKLKKTATKGHLHIEAEPAETVILLDGGDVGHPPYDADIVAGAHKVELKATGYVTHKDAIALTVGDQRTLQTSLNKEPPPPTPWFKQWWLWTGVVAVVAIGVGVSYYASTTAPAPYMGTLGPGYFQIGK